MSSQASVQQIYAYVGRNQLAAWSNQHTKKMGSSHQIHILKEAGSVAKKNKRQHSLAMQALSTSPNIVDQNYKVTNDQLGHCSCKQRCLCGWGGHRYETWKRSIILSAKPTAVFETDKKKGGKYFEPIWMADQFFTKSDSIEPWNQNILAAIRITNDTDSDQLRSPMLHAVCILWTPLHRERRDEARMNMGIVRYWWSIPCVETEKGRQTDCVTIHKLLLELLCTQEYRN